MDALLNVAIARSVYFVNMSEQAGDSVVTNGWACDRSLVEYLQHYDQGLAAYIDQLPSDQYDLLFETVFSVCSVLSPIVHHDEADQKELYATHFVQFAHLQCKPTLNNF
jgi:hypothetical protein